MAYTTEQKLQRLIARRNPDKLSAIEQAAHSGAFGLNPLPLPTDKQKESGNYKKGKFSLYGLRIAIEQPANSYRTGIDENDNKWQSRLAANYGYILGTIGSDGDPIDCFIGSYPQADTVYIINQYVDGDFDEHKIMLCFPCEREAIAAYQTSYEQGWNGLHSIVKASVNQFKKWLAHGSKSRPVTKTSLPIELNKMQTVQWDANGLPLNTDLSTILYHIRADEDGRGLLLDAVTTDEFNADYAADFIQEDYLDSLSVFYNKLNMTARLIANTMNKVGGDLQCTITKADDENGIEANPLITKPYKKYGVLNVSLVFTLSDAQTITVVLHNPDSTPSKIQAHDMMVAWKWLLNKKDITAVVSPESGKDLAVQEIAKRIMQLASKNSAAFTKANQNAADTMKQIDDLSTEINDLGMVLNAKQKELAVVQSDYEDWLVSKATAPVISDFVPTHTYHDADLGQDVPVMRNEDSKNWQSADGTEYVDIDSEVVAIGAGAIDPQPDKPMTDLFKSGLLKALKQKTANTDGSAPSIDDFALRVGKLILEKNISQDMLAELAGTNADKAVDALYPVIWGNSQPTQGIDPVAKSNIEAANISAAIKKKAIAYLSANPTSHKLFEKETPAGKKAYAAIMESVKAALFAEIKSLHNDFRVSDNYVQLTLRNPNEDIGGRLVEITVKVDAANDYKMTFGVNDYSRSTANTEITDYKNLFDSTQTLEDLKSWGFALPFDLDVKAFVANVIKPVVDEFLAKQAVVDPEMDKTPPTMSDEDVKKAIINSHHDTDLMFEVADFLGIDPELDETDVYAGLTKDPNITPDKLRQAYELVSVIDDGKDEIPYEFYSKFEERDDEVYIKFSDASERTQTAWIIEKIIKQHNGVVSWGDFNGAKSNSIFDSVLNGVIGQFGTKAGGVVGYIEINDDGSALISLDSNGRLSPVTDNVFTNEMSKIKDQIDNAFSGHVDAEIVEGDFPDWKTKAAPVAEVTQPEPTKPLTEIQQYELKLSRLQAMQDRMKAVNKIIKSKTLTDDQKRSKLVDSGFSSEADRLGIKERWKDGMADGYADYELTNNNATIKNTKARIDELKKRELSASMAASGDRETSYNFDGGTVDLDYDDDRLRVNFASKPNSEMIAKLKSNGFKWSPNAGAWQRQLTDNAIWSTNRLLGTEIKSSNDLIRDLQNKGANVPEPTPTPEPQLPVVEPPTNSFDADIEALRSETDYTVFNDKLDELAGKIEEAGLMDQYEPQLNELADLLTELLKKAA